MVATRGALTGQTLRHYAVLERLGEGGMGVVYKARDTRLGRLAALKVLAPGWCDDPESRQRLLREARTASTLNHPNILTIFEVDADAETDFIAMEYVAGGTLAELLAAGPVEPGRALRLAAQVADALAAAHAASIVHRDLKPSNVMLAEGDRVKLVDFGLAKLATGSARTLAAAEPLTATGVVVGTAPYMSPEQASGRQVDARSDLFSLGTILYEMLAGRRPFLGESHVDTLAAILRDPPPPIPGLAPEVAELVERCLRKDARDRFQSAAELKVAIQACLAPTPRDGRRSVAVLPFANMTGTPEDDVLCEGIAEEVINALTQDPALRVIARTSAFVVGRMGLDARAAGARLGVATLLEGSVRRHERHVRVTVQLVDATDGSHLWSERYDRELSDVLALEDEIAVAIARRLHGEHARPVAGRAPRTTDAEAHTAYLEGRYHFARGTPDALARALACYERAIARDGASALAYDSLAELYWFLGFFGNAPPRDAFAQSTWYALRALELDDTLAQTHALLGMLRKELDYNWPEVERELGRALELARQSPLVRLRYAISLLLPHARLDEAMTELEAVLASDPLSLFVHWWLAVIAYLARRPGKVLDTAGHMLELDPNHFLGHWALGIGLVESGDAGGALAAFERAHELAGHSPFTLGFLAYGYGRAARADDARRLLAQAETRAASEYVPPTTFALAFVGLDEWDAAFDWLHRAIAGRDPIIMPIKSFPFLDPVREDPRYLELLRLLRLD